jgi:D-arginine dehydrogenase
LTTESFDIVVIGGGISGVSLAARLAPHARVCVVEAEEQLGTQATGRSAALFVEAYGPPEIRRLTRLSRAFFEGPPDGFSEAPLARRRGGLVFGDTSLRTKLEAEFALAQKTATVEWLEADELLAHAPLLRPGVAAAGFVEPNAFDIETHALLHGFAREARRHGAEIVTSAPVSHLAKEGSGWRIDAGARSLACGIVVNAAGAWADRVAALAKVAEVGLEPRRRTAATLPAPRDIAALLPSHPFATAVDESFYFKPETGAIMVSLSEETPSEPCDAYPDDVDVATALERFHAATIVPRARPTATWAGLRTFVRDRVPVVGFAPDRPGFFWYAGQGGYGIQTSPALSALAAKAVLSAPLDADDAEALRALQPDRFVATAAHA